MEIYSRDGFGFCSHNFDWNVEKMFCSKCIVGIYGKLLKNATFHIDWKQKFFRFFFRAWMKVRRTIIKKNNEMKRWETFQCSIFSVYVYRKRAILIWNSSKLNPDKYFPSIWINGIIICIQTMIFWATDKYFWWFYIKCIFWSSQSDSICYRIRLAKCK